MHLETCTPKSLAWDIRLLLSTNVNLCLKFSMKLVKLDEQPNTVKKWFLCLKRIQPRLIPGLVQEIARFYFSVQNCFQALGLSGLEADPGDAIVIFRSARAVMN